MENCVGCRREHRPLAVQILFKTVEQVLEQVEPVGDLSRGGRAEPRAGGVRAGAVTRNDLNSRVCGQPHL